MRAQRAYLLHILQCAARIRQDAAGGREAVFASATLQDAIARNLQLLCESAQRLSTASKAQHPEINWPGIAGLRNILVHDYFSVDFAALWTIGERDLPRLEVAVQQILSHTKP